MLDTRAQAIAAGIAHIRERIAAAARRAGRDPAAVTVIGVSKTFPAEVVVAAVRAGLRDIGENRVQEGAAKRDAVVRALSEADAPAPTPTWHLIGHLQTNKVRTAIQRFDILHAIDSLRLAEAISRGAVAPVPVLLEVNVAGEASKFGFAPAETLAAVERIGGLPRLELRGLMTVAPEVEDPEQARAVFRTLRELRDAAGLTELSMGMSGDFEVAVEEGATMVRIGRAIFGERGGVQVPGS